MTSSPLPQPSSPATAVFIGSAAPVRRRLSGLDGLRGLAVTLVLVFHLFPPLLGGGFIGVDVFFVISGFLITGLIVTERERTGRFSPGRFWLRRARRLLPALVPLILVCCTAAWLIGGDVLVGLGWKMLGASTFSYNWVSLSADTSYFGAGQPELFRNLWSLAVEEQFYLVWPLVLLLLLQLRRPRMRLALVALLAVASAAWMGVAFQPGTDPTRVYYGSDSHSFGLLIGAGLALLLRPRAAVAGAADVTGPADADRGAAALGTAGVGAVGPNLLGRFLASTRPWWGVAAVAGLLGAAVWLPDDGAFTYRGGLALVSLLTAVTIWAGIAEGWFGRVLDTRPLRYLGERSYGLYLWHWPLLVLLQLAAPFGSGPAGLVGTGLLTLVLTVAVAGLSYRWLELPIRRHGLRATVRRLRAYIATAVPRRAPAAPGADSLPATVSSEPSSQPATAASGPGSLPATATPGPGSLPATAGSQTGSLPATATPASGSLPATAASQTGSLPATATPASASLPATAGSQSDSLPATAPSAPGSLPATAGSQSDSLPATAASAPGSLPATAGSQSDSLPATAASAPGSRPDPAESQPQPPHSRRRVITRLVVAGATTLALLAGTTASVVFAPAVTSAEAEVLRGQQALMRAEKAAEAQAAEAAAAQAAGLAAEVTRGSMITAVGDSVMLASAAELQAEFPGIVIDAAVSRGMEAAPEILATQRDAGTLRDVVVIGLGTNRQISKADLAAIMKVIGPARQLILVNAFADRDWTAGVNTQLADFSAQRSRVALADWHDAIAPHLDVLADDGIHPGPTGGAIYADTVATALDSLADAPQTRGPGADTMQAFRAP